MLMSAVFLLSACPGCPSVTPVEDAGPSGLEADAGGEPDAGGGDAGGSGEEGACRMGDHPPNSGCELGCVQECSADGGWGACQPPGGAPCAAVHAEARCLAGGTCGRDACELEYFDFDPSVPGCETRCVNRRCVLVDGGTVTLSNDPLHERSAAFHALSSGGSFGDLTQRSDGGYQNTGILGELAAGVSSSDGGYMNLGGFMSVGSGPPPQRR